MYVIFMHTSMSKCKCCVILHPSQGFVLPQILSCVRIVHSDVTFVVYSTASGAEWGRAGQGR